MLLPLKLSQQSDESLMKRAANGNERAFEELYKRYSKPLMGFFFRRLNHEEDLAADLTHDTFLRLYAARTSYREGKSFKVWLYAIAYNLWKNYFRNQPPATSQLYENIPDKQDLEIELDKEIFSHALEKVIKTIPPPQAMLFSLHYEEELTIPQISQITALPEGTIKSRLHKTMNIIKKGLKEYENYGK